ncbi:MAG: hypothetical protein V4671_08615 [Armatimonadota bacterium]
MGCFATAIAVFGFFAFLLSSAQEMAGEAKKARADKARSVAALKDGSAGAASKAGRKTVTADDTHLSSLLQAAQVYSADHNGLLPPMKTPEAFRTALFPKYVSRETMFVSVRSKKVYLPNPALSGKRLRSFTNPAEVIALYGPLDTTTPEEEAQTQVIYLDGGQERVTTAEWGQLRKKARLP